MKKWTSKIIVLALALTLVLSACGQVDNGGNDNAGGEKGGDKQSVNKETIDIGVIGWAETIAVSHLWKKLLEEKGYNVNLVTVNKASLWTGLSTGKIDVNPEVWLPYTDKPYLEKYKDDVETGEVWYKKATLGFVVPKYLKDVNSIEDLNAHADEFVDHTIFGIEAGSSEMRLAKDAVKKYNLKLELVPSSTAAMTGQLSKSIKQKEPVVVTLWDPHWAFSRYDLKYLDDPKGVFGKPDDIKWVAHKGFMDDYPTVTKYFNNWNMSHEDLATLMDVIHNQGDGDAAVDKGVDIWMKDHQDLVDSWMKK